jgi:hypothetical protein
VHEVLLRDTSTSARMLADVGILQAHDDSDLDDDEVQAWRRAEKGRHERDMTEVNHAAVGAHTLLPSLL